MLMIKTLLSAGALLLLSATTSPLAAQEAQGKVVTVYTMEGDEELSSMFVNASVNGVSNNGEYAVGNGVDLSMNAFIWSRSTGKFSVITGSMDDFATVYDVSDDGTVVGTFYYDNNGEITESSKAYIVPGIWKDGKWTPLELEMPIARGDANGEARWISADGHIVTGYIRARYYISNSDGSQREVTKLRPAVWIDGQLQRWAGELPDGKLTAQGMFAYTASDDGKVIGGIYEHYSGSRAPSVWVDGELHRIYGEKDIDPNVDDYFFEGRVSCVSPSGKYACGYWSVSGGYDPTDLVGFVYNVETGESEEIEGIPNVSYVLDNGTAFGCDLEYADAYIRTADYKGTLAQYLTELSGTAAPELLPTVIESASEDASVIGGWYMVVSDFGGIMAPSIVTVSDVSDGIHSATDGTFALRISDGVCQAPAAARLMAYDTAGRLVRQTEGTTLSLAGLKGQVVVKAVLTNGGTIAQNYMAR